MQQAKESAFGSRHEKVARVHSSVFCIGDSGLETRADLAHHILFGPPVNAWFAAWRIFIALCGCKFLLISSRFLGVSLACSNSVCIASIV